MKIRTISPNVAALIALTVAVVSYGERFPIPVNTGVTKPNTGAVAKPNTGAVTKPSTGAVTKPSTGATTRPSTTGAVPAAGGAGTALPSGGAADSGVHSSTENIPAVSGARPAGSSGNGTGLENFLTDGLKAAVKEVPAPGMTPGDATAFNTQAKLATKAFKDAEGKALIERIYKSGKGLTPGEESELMGPTQSVMGEIVALPITDAEKLAMAKHFEEMLLTPKEGKPLNGTAVSGLAKVIQTVRGAMSVKGNLKDGKLIPKATDPIVAEIIKATGMTKAEVEEFFSCKGGGCVPDVIAAVMKGICSI